MSRASFYGRRAKYGGMDVCGARRLKTLGTENARLKKRLADAVSDAAAPKEPLSKEMVGPAACREACERLRSVRFRFYAVIVERRLEIGAIERPLQIPDPRDASRCSSGARRLLLEGAGKLGDTRPGAGSLSVRPRRTRATAARLAAFPGAMTGSQSCLTKQVCYLLRSALSSSAFPPF
jgi:hypothetical protein